MPRHPTITLKEKPKVVVIKGTSKGPTVLLKPKVVARATASNEIIWLECEHFCHDERSHVLLRWNRPSGPVYRTGYWHDAKLKYVGSGDVEFRTQPNYLSVLEPTSPIFVLPRTQATYDAMLDQAARAMYANERRYESKKMTWETTWEAVRAAYLKDARGALAAIGIKP